MYVYFKVNRKFNIFYNNHRERFKRLAVINKEIKLKKNCIKTKFKIQFKFYYQH